MLEERTERIRHWHAGRVLAALEAQQALGPRQWAPFAVLAVVLVVFLIQQLVG